MPQGIPATASNSKAALLTWFVSRVAITQSQAFEEKGTQDEQDLPIGWAL
jgi:hypothetical protein